MPDIIMVATFIGLAAIASLVLLGSYKRLWASRGHLKIDGAGVESQIHATAMPVEMLEKPPVQDKTDIAIQQPAESQPQEPAALEVKPTTVATEAPQHQQIIEQPKEETHPATKPTRRRSTASTRRRSSRRSAKSKGMSLEGTGDNKASIEV